MKWTMMYEKEIGSMKQAKCQAQQQGAQRVYCDPVGEAGDGASWRGAGCVKSGLD